MATYESATDSTVNWRDWGVWTAGFLAFPIAGLAGRAVAGPVDSVGAAVAGGLVTGAVLGLGQALASRRRLPALPWAAATAAGTGLGLAAGAALVGYGTDLADLALMGAVSGVAIGAAQAAVLPAGTAGRLRWALAGPVLWALGWTVTTLAGVEVSQQFTVFGATGALAYALLSGLVLAVVGVRRGGRWR